MRAAHAAEAAYLEHSDDTRSVPNFADYSLELTRPFRGLRLWLALKLYGWEPFAQALDLNRSLAVRLHQRLREDSRFEVPWTPDLSTVAFRLRDRGDADTLGLMNAINERGRVLLSSTTIGRRAYIRACFLSHRSSEGTLNDLLVYQAMPVGASVASGRSAVAVPTQTLSCTPQTPGLKIGLEAGPGAGHLNRPGFCGDYVAWISGSI